MTDAQGRLPRALTLRRSAPSSDPAKARRGRSLPVLLPDSHRAHFATPDVRFLLEGQGEIGNKMLERKRARERKQKRREDKRRAPRPSRSREKGSEVPRGGKRGGGWKEKTSRLRAPRPPLGRSRPRHPPGRASPPHPRGSRLGRGHNYTSALGKDLKLSGADCSLEARPCGHQRGARPVHRNILQGLWVREGKKTHQNKLLSSSMGSENKSLL